MPRRWKIFLLVTLLSIAADQATKVWARHSLDVVVAGTGQHASKIWAGDSPPASGPYCRLPGDLVRHGAAPPRCHGTATPVVRGYWAWQLSFNPGSAFGLFHSASGARVLLSIVGVLAVLGMGWMVRRARDTQTWLLIALGLVAGGAVGNLIDRIYYGVVTDFTLWHWKDKFDWPIFNVADVVLVVGVALLVLDLGKDGKKDKKDKKGKKGKDPKGEQAKAAG